MTTDTKRSTSQEGSCCSHSTRFLSGSLILNHSYTPAESTGKPPAKPQKDICPKPQLERFWLAVDLHEVLCTSATKKAQNNKKIQVAATSMKHVFQLQLKA